MLNQLIKKTYHNRIFSSTFHTVVHELQRELKDCKTVLDLGCGPSSPIEYCPSVRYSVGVEPFAKYLKQSQSRKIHNRYILAKIDQVDFPDRSFDAVIMVEVLEHMTKDQGYQIIKKIQKWAKKKVIITTPNGFIKQKSLDGNELQQHMSGWTHDEMKKLGFHTNGLAGPKFLRQELPNDEVGEDLTAAIRFRPKLLWFMLATLSQVILYYFPQLAFELFNVKDVT